jgi:hypothetical protein
MHAVAEIGHVRCVRTRTSPKIAFASTLHTRRERTKLPSSELSGNNGRVVIPGCFGPRGTPGPNSFLTIAFASEKVLALAHQFSHKHRHCDNLRSFTFVSGTCEIREMSCATELNYRRLTRLIPTKPGTHAMAPITFVK